MGEKLWVGGEEKDRDGFDPVKLHPPQKWGVSQGFFFFLKETNFFPFLKFLGFSSSLIATSS